MLITPQFKALKLAKVIGLDQPLYIKREDQHILGSHKGRSMPIMIEHHQKQGWNNFCISSSGNAALAAILYIQEHNKIHPQHPLSLSVYIGKNIDRYKQQILEENIKDGLITLEKVANPKQTAFQMEKDEKAKFLRQSTDEIALEGYENLAEELLEIKDLSAVFIPTSSATTAVGLYKGFKKNNAKIQIHIVQTPKCFPMIKNIDPNTKELPTAEKSLAGAIVDKIAHRKDEISGIVKETDGYGWLAHDGEIKQIIKLVKDTTNLDISPNSALSVVGLVKAMEKKWKFKGPVVCIFTGR